MKINHQIIFKVMKSNSIMINPISHSKKLTFQSQNLSKKLELSLSKPINKTTVSKCHSKEPLTKKKTFFFISCAICYFSKDVIGWPDPIFLRIIFFYVFFNNNLQTI